VSAPPRVLPYTLGTNPKRPQNKRKKGEEKKKKLSLFNTPNSFANSLCTRVFFFSFFLFLIYYVAAKVAIRSATTGFSQIWLQYN
jgi:hypothetical protein